jgi:urea transport system permease protein
MVIFCALGGRLSILGAVYGALLVNAAKSGFSESFPELWPFAMGALFIGVVLAFPNGMAGLYQTYVIPLEDKIFRRKKATATAAPKSEADKSDDYDPMTDNYSPEKS